MRGSMGLALLVMLAPAAAALPTPDAALQLDSLQRILLPAQDGPSLAGPVRDLAASPGAAPQQVPPPAMAQARDAAGSALLWLLGIGGVAGVLGWRQLSLRNALDHPGRLAILQLLRRRPGLHLRAVARELGLSVQHAAYHLRVLEKLGLVRSLEAGGKRCFHEAGLAATSREALLQAALAPTMAQRQVLAFVALHPGASQSEVARQLGMLQGAARWHLQKLVRQGRLTEQRAGKALAYRLPPPQ